MNTQPALYPLKYFTVYESAALPLSHRGLSELKSITFLKGIALEQSGEQKMDYLSIALQDLKERMPTFFEEGRIGGYAIYPGNPLEEPNHDLIRIPVMLDHPLEYDLRKGITLTEIVRQNNSVPPEQRQEIPEHLLRQDAVASPVSLGCDYFLNRTGKICYAPSAVELEARIKLIMELRRDIFREAG